MKKSAFNKKPVTKILTGFRIDPNIKELAIMAALQENRSFSNYLENLIRKDIDSKNEVSKKPRK